VVVVVVAVVVVVVVVVVGKVVEIAATEGHVRHQSNNPVVVLGVKSDHGSQ